MKIISGSTHFSNLVKKICHGKHYALFTGLEIHRYYLFHVVDAQRLQVTSLSIIN